MGEDLQGPLLDSVVLALEARGHAAGEGHSLFPQLYYFTTKHWIAFSRTCADPALIQLLVLHFFDRYEAYVLRQPRSGRVAGHWQHHIRLLEDDRGILRPQLGLLFGIRAHIRFDLAEAICNVRDSYVRLYRREPDMAVLRSMIYGRGANCVFRQACLEFFAAKAASGRLGPRLLHALAYLLDWLWIPVFQWSRKQAWREAMNSIATGTPIRRQMAPCRAGDACA